MSVENSKAEEKVRFVEVHVIQNFAPSNLNRSDTGAPKDCDFGGYRRARISSQCFKRAIRRESNFRSVLEANGGSVRTRRLIIEIAKKISEQEIPPEKIVKVVAEVFNEAGIERPKVKKSEDEEKEKENTKLVLFMNSKAIEEMVILFKNSGLLDGNNERKDELIKGLGKALAQSLKSPDIALFGRMIEIDSKKPFGKMQLGVDAASQVAHAISTHKTGVEFDFYTAVDDLLPQGETGAGMMGTLEFTSACFYRYANLDLNQLNTNLQDPELEAATIEAFVRAFVDAVPTGKQNSYAAQQKPSFVMVVARDAGLLSLTNAFAKPVQTNKGDLVEESIKALDQHWGEMSEMYGKKGIKGAWFASAKMKKLEALGDSVKAENGNSMIDALVTQIKSAIKPNES
ncbi:MAG: type I-E CRISPR-associated protein Cas7/Cse4/CasC [Acidobacteria bacterium]|nr:type I-E CRISPR-associated protein Cas7/Cse4/CasC [Acidobacteriota bacterium]